MSTYIINILLYINMNRYTSLPYNYLLMLQLNKQYQEKIKKKELKQRKRIIQIQNMRRQQFMQQNNKSYNHKSNSNISTRKFPSYLYDKGQNNLNIIRKKWK